MHVERQEITFVQRPNTSAHVPPCWKISLHHFHICRLVWSYIWQVDMSTLPHKLILAQKSKCYLTSHCTAAGFLAFCPPFFPPDSFTPKTPKRSSASCSCFTPFTKPLNDLKNTALEQEGVKLSSGCQPQDTVAGGQWTNHTQCSRALAPAGGRKYTCGFFTT